MGGFPLLSNTGGCDCVQSSIRSVVFLSFLGKFIPTRICLDWSEETYLAHNEFRSCFNEWKMVNNKVFLIHKK